MPNVKKVFVSLLAILMIIVFFNDRSYSQEKPSQKTIKQVILKGYARGIAKFTKNKPNIKVSDLKFDSFKITKGFFAKAPLKRGETVPYNIEVNYKISYIQSQNLVKWKTDKIKQYQDNIRSLQAALKKHEAAANKSKQMIEFDKKAIIGNKKNIEDVKKFPDIKKEKQAIIKKNGRMYFVKKGAKWFGYLGWK